ncbi:MAG: ribonuclease T, partial [Pseudomonadota bacterium]
MKAVILLLVTGMLWLSGSPGRADEAPGRFDYYVMALSWQPSWCAETGDERGANSCDAGTGTGFILHGLWPQR